MENKDVINYKIINVTFFVFIIYLLYKLNLKKYNKIKYVIVKNIKSLFSIKFYLL